VTMLSIIKALLIAGGVFCIGHGVVMAMSYGIESLIAFVGLGFALIVFGKLLPTRTGIKLPRIRIPKKKEKTSVSSANSRSTDHSPIYYEKPKKKRKLSLKNNFPIFMLIIYLIIHALYLIICNIGAQQQEIEKIRRIGDTICVYSIGMVIVSGIYWQYLLSFKKDRLADKKAPQRIKLTAFICLVFITGIIGREIIEIYVVKDATHNFSSLFRLSFHAILLSAVLIVKAYFGPLVLTSTLAIFSFYLISRGEFMPMAFVDNVFSMIVDVFPETFRNIYLVFTILYVAGATFMDTFREGSNALAELAE
jgi:hypothetical protein